jgi:isopenicillin-N N-acyltransferase like protein
VASSIVDLTTGEYWIAHGNPCENEYELLPWNLYDSSSTSPAARIPLRSAPSIRA